MDDIKNGEIEIPETEIDLELLPDEEGIAPDLQKKIKRLRDELKKCEEERKQYLDGWQRAKADRINYKNDEGKRMEDMARFIAAGFALDVLPVLDSFDLALGHKMPYDVEKGVLLIRSQLEDILKKRGIEEIGSRAGDAFNPEKHESMGELESDFPEGTIAEIVQRGYEMRAKILRPVRVRLSKGRHA
jgi:molecular chaperone GrpE